MSKYLVATKGLGFIYEAKTKKDVESKIKKLKKLGYKKPMVYVKE